jgi:integrase
MGRLAGLSRDPIEGMAGIAADAKNPPELRGRMYAELTRYVFPKRAGVKCRLHDMRHTVATKMAEGTPEITMLALLGLGHMSRAMLERYSHIHMAAKRAAVEAFR